jgi:multidrug transporter EmrE-like cation transporter
MTSAVVPAIPLFIWIGAMVSILLSAAAQLLMKIGMTNLRTAGHIDVASVNTIMSVIFDRWVFSGLACYGLSAALWLVVLSRLPLSMAYPLIAVGIAIVVLMSAFALGETIGLAHAAGVALIICGVLLIGFNA